MSARRSWLAMLVLATLAACARPPLPPSPPPVAMVAVVPPDNRTGDVFLVVGGSLVERYLLDTLRATVSDLLQGEAREQLRARGVTVASADVVAMALARPTANGGDAGAAATASDTRAALAAAGVDGAMLRLEIRRWTPDAPTQPAFVIVGIEATLIDIASGRTLWHDAPPVRPIPTPGAVTIGVAHEIAARVAVAEILESWNRRQGTGGRANR